jgi:hypothetical protein
MPVGALSIAAALEARGHAVTLANYSKEGVRSAAATSVHQTGGRRHFGLHAQRTDSFRLAAEIRKTASENPHRGGRAPRRVFGEEILPG